MTEESSEKNQSTEFETLENEHKDQQTPSESSPNEEMENSCEIKTESIDFKEKYFRSLAEMENMRKRLLREQQDAVRLGIQKIVLDMLLPIDRLEEALAFSKKASSEVQNWAVGFNMILQQFIDCLSAQGINSFSGEGQIFDPIRHDPIEGIETDQESPGKILKVFAKGYTMHNRVIRAAKIAVAQPIKSANAIGMESDNSVPKQDSISKEIDNPEGSE